MYLQTIEISDLRSVRAARMEFPSKQAGWHVLLGANGSGKTSIVRALALLMMGEKEAYAARQEFETWIRQDARQATVSAELVRHPQYDMAASKGKLGNLIALQAKIGRESTGVSLEFLEDKKNTQRAIWGGNRGWFCASFGPYRRFTGGDNRYDRLFVSNKRLAPHLSALGEDVALTDAMSWLSSKYNQSLQDEKNGTNGNAAKIFQSVTHFFNENAFLPHGARITSVRGDVVLVKDGNGCEVSLDQLSDGYRSALSLVLELIRQMFELYGEELMLQIMQQDTTCINAPGVVIIDEIDAHLHPAWQRDIGHWLTRSFPELQFIVTTHSPIICRAVMRENGQTHGSVWRLPIPGEDEDFRQITGEELDALLYGDVLEAYATGLFGQDVLRAAYATQMQDKLAKLNTLALKRDLSADEQKERQDLRRKFPAALPDFMALGN